MYARAPRPQEIEIGPILERMSAHLDRLAAQVYDIENAVGAAMVAGADGSDALIRDFQTLDFLRQSLEDLALLSLLLGQIGEGLPEEPASLSSRLKMEVTRLIVMGSLHRDGSQPFDDTGDLDLF